VDIPELSEDGKKQLEEIVLAAFHNLLLGVVDNVNDQIRNAGRHVDLAMMNQATVGVRMLNGTPMSFVPTKDTP
jgi:hypothetical protein